MPVGVVDLLELVEVEEDQGDAVAVPGGALELERELAGEGGVVEQVGEGVVTRLVRELGRRAVEVGDDAFDGQLVDRVVDPMLERQHVVGLEARRPFLDEPPENAPEDEELGDDVARGEAERLPLPRMVPHERGQRAAAAQPLRVGLRELLGELGDERRHVAELSDAAEPREGRDLVVALALRDDLQRKLPRLGANLLRQLLECLGSHLYPHRNPYRQSRRET